MPVVLNKGSIVAGSSKIWAGLNAVTELAKKTDVPAAYVHPSTKVCIGGDAGTLNGKTAAQIVGEASTSKGSLLYTGTIRMSSNSDTVPIPISLSLVDPYSVLTFDVTVNGISGGATGTAILLVNGVIMVYHDQSWPLPGPKISYDFRTCGRTASDKLYCSLLYGLGTESFNDVYISIGANQSTFMSYNNRFVSSFILSIFGK